MHRIATLLVLLATVIPLAAGTAQALDVPPKPTSPVVDQAEVLTPEQEQSLASKLYAAETQTGNQVGVLTIRSLQGDALEDYSLRVAREWGIGSDKRDSGVLLLVAIDDRKLRIEVGYGLEGALPDIRANRIITNRIKPEFVQGNYAAGIDSGVDGILLAIQNEKDDALGTGSTAKQGVPWESILFGVFFIPAWLGSILARSKNWWAGGFVGAIIAGIIALFIGTGLIAIVLFVMLPILGLLFDFLVSRNYQRHAQSGSKPSWWAGGSTLGGGSSWGGFGGGGFGGGGASGDW